MRRKRSKSEEREIKKRYREKRSNEKILSDKEKDRERKKIEWSIKTDEEKRIMRDSVKIKMRKFRKNNFQGAVGKMERKYDEKNANKERIRNKRENQTEEEKIGEIKALKERMAKLRANQTDEEKEFEKEKDMRRKQKIRSNKSFEDIKYENVIKRLKMRKARKEQTGKEHLTKNLEAKKGMRLFSNEGRLRDFSKRLKKTHKKEDFLDWQDYWESGEKERQKLTKLQPDIVDKINEKVRLEKERKRQHDEECGELYENYWMDEDDDAMVSYVSNSQTQEEKEMIDEAERQEKEALVRYKKNEKKKKMQAKREQVKKAMATPLPPLPERELCQYEKIRENIIKEREEAFAKLKFFEDLHRTKVKIGLYQKDKPKNT